ncbi:MAG TPA: CRISPR-associated endonuclease Cas2 [Pirellulaceae bacterium]|nr:CRISPR-associated endonuclease Cas2 [Pirellulaceae bacterium]HMO92557.1 CRISPR-associated endonuclease Cas2 [Pirellulaceae bacterium]HMP70645.1 CRISPR-associated endonuclease Cas2 [Pirellulaceae bacterium]
MWLLAMFDLPVKTKTNRKRYARFRKLLLVEGFTMLQFSVYARHFSSEESADAIRRNIENQIPENGQVRILPVTDRQFAKMDVFYGKKRCKSERPAEQYLLF